MRIIYTQLYNYCRSNKTLKEYLLNILMISRGTVISMGESKIYLH
jgi:hypothetical protein